VVALRELVETLRDQISKLEAQAEQQRQDYQIERQAERERLSKAEGVAERERAALEAAREVWEARLDGLSADLTEARRAQAMAAESHARREVELQRLQSEMERMRSRPWWMRLFKPG
jgi:chromosome segregation ATPase